MKKIITNIKIFFGKGACFSTFERGWALLFLFAGLFLLGFLIAKNESNSVEVIKQTKILMGTVAEIQVRDSDEEKARRAISKAFYEIKRIDELFSAYNEESVVWKLNHGVNQSNLSEELIALVTFSDSIWRLSNGSFDVSLGNLIELWGFSNQKPSVPNKKKIIESLASSGWKNVQLKNDNSISLVNKTNLDFGAVAKGYAVDRAIDLIKISGVSAALVNAGGEVKGFGNDWIVGIQHPRNKNEMLGKLKLNDMSVATSGDYEQFFEVNGKRYHHILNPKTGMPANECQSVTVVCKENKLADALATAVFVMGIEDGLKLVNTLDNVEAMIIASDGKIKTSKGFNKFLMR